MKMFLNRNKFLIYCLLFFIFFKSEEALPQEPYNNVSSIIHVQSNISDGRFTIEQIMALAKQKGVKVVVITDTLLRRWEYSIWPLSKVLRRTLEEGSIIRFGAKEYLKEISSAQERHPDMLVVAAAEVAPFYFWKGNYFDRSLTLHSWHKKLLVLGLGGEQDYRKLPVVSSYLPYPQKLIHWLSFWPLGLVGVGLWLTEIQKKKRFSFGGQVFSNLIRPFKSSGYFLIIFGAILLLNAFRFPVSNYDPYHGDQGIKPYQALIDYANRKNALTFWTHPEASLKSSFAGARVVTPAYKNDLLRSVDYTGFAGIYFDNSTATLPGDIWDRLLGDYCSGKRKKPAWIFGEVGWDGTKETWSIAGIETILLLKDFNQDAIIDALRNGRMFAKLNRGENSFSLDKFSVCGEKNNCGFMGENLRISGKPKVIIKASFKEGQPQETSFKLIKDGVAIKEFKVKSGKIAILFKDNDFAANKKSFYRLEISNDSCLILTNPVFIRQDVN